MTRLEQWLQWKVVGKWTRRTRPRKNRYSGPYRDPQYLDWIRSQPSCVSGEGPCQAAHTGHDGGMRQKSSDLTAVPLTPREHREYHRIGRAEFERRYGVDFDYIVEGLTTEYWSGLSAAELQRFREAA